MNNLQSFWSTLLSASLPAILILVLILVLTAILVLVVVVAQFGTRLRYLSTPIYDKIVKEAEEKAEHILVDAREESGKMRTNAQAEVEKIYADRKTEDEQFRAQQVKHVEDITTHAKALLNKQTSTIANLSEEIVIEFKKQSAVAEKILTDEAGLIKQELTKVAADVHNDYKELMNETKHKIEEDLTKEIESARQAVRVYRQERLTLLNKEIVGLVEDTVRIALNKSLSFGEHRDLILKSLAEAKKEGIFSTSS